MAFPRLARINFTRYVRSEGGGPRRVFVYVQYCTVVNNRNLGLKLGYWYTGEIFVFGKNIRVFHTNSSQMFRFPREANAWFLVRRAALCKRAQSSLYISWYGKRAVILQLITSSYRNKGINFVFTPNLMLKNFRFVLLFSR